MIEFHNWVLRKAKFKLDFFFVQIGANDGRSIGGVNGGHDDPDPIFRYVVEYGWSGILVEPVKYIFDELKQNYKGLKNLHFENAAIDNLNGYRNLYRVRKIDDRRLPWFYEKLGTFYLDVLLNEKCSIPNLERLIVIEKVRCIGLNELMKKHGVSKIDLMVIDAEGHDYEIFQEIDFVHVRPRSILMEHKHLSADALFMCKVTLNEFGYQLFSDERDIFATIDF